MLCSSINLYTLFNSLVGISVFLYPKVVSGGYLCAVTLVVLDFDEK